MRAECRCFRCARSPWGSVSCAPLAGKLPGEVLHRDGAEAGKKEGVGSGKFADESPGGRGW